MPPYMSKVLITGSSGFIGTRLYAACVAERHEVFTFNETDIQSYANFWEHLENLIKAVDCVFHIGANSSTEASNINNVMGLNYEFSKRLFDYAAKYSKPVIFASSASLYGRGDNFPHTLYAWSKKAAEDYGLLKVSKFVSLRYFNVYGPGESHKGKMASVAYQAFKHAQKRSEPFMLLPSSPHRDFIYVDDVVSATLYAYKNLDKVASGVYDVGTGKAETFESVLQELGVKYQYLDESHIPSWYQFFTQADSSKFLPGWKPQFTLQLGLAAYKQFLER